MNQAVIFQAESINYCLYSEIELITEKHTKEVTSLLNSGDTHLCCDNNQPH
jgi:hypothetical protein